MYMVTWLLRIIVSYLSGPNEGHDQVISVPTPGLGAGQVRCNIWTPHAAEKSPSRPLILMLEGGGFVLGHPKDGRRTSRLLAEKVRARSHVIYYLTVIKALADQGNEFYLSLS
jgi:acetyl esterase